MKKDLIERQFVLLNDEFISKDKFDLNVFNYGLTIYEVIKVKNCIPIFFEDYLQRLDNSLKIIGKRLWIDFDELKNRILKLIQKNCIKDESHLKLAISFDNSFFGQKQNLIFAYFFKINLPSRSDYETGVKTISLLAERKNPNAKIFQPELRNQTESLIVKEKIYEVILISKDKKIKEGSKSNIFFIKNNQLYTPPTTVVLPGIIRKKVIELAKKLNIKVHIADIYYDSLPDFNSAFLTGTSKHILPIRWIDNFEFNPKNFTLRLLKQEMKNLVESYINLKRKNFQCTC